MKNREIVNVLVNRIAKDVFMSITDKSQSVADFFEYVDKIKLLDTIDSFVLQHRAGAFAMWLSDHIFDLLETRYVKSEC